MIELKFHMSIDSILKKIDSMFIDQDQIEAIMGRAALILIDEIDSHIEEYSKSNTTYRPLRSGNGDFKRDDEGKLVYGDAPALIDTAQYRGGWDVETKKDFNRIMGIVFNDKEYAKYIEDRYLIAKVAFDSCKDDIRQQVKEELAKFYEVS